MQSPVRRGELGSFRFHEATTFAVGAAPKGGPYREGILGQKKLEILDTMLDGKEPVDGPSRLTGSNLPGHMRC